MTATRTRSAGRLSGCANAGCSLAPPSIVLRGSRIGPVLAPGSTTGMLSMLIECPRLGREVPQDLRRIARDDGVRRHVARNGAAGAHDGVFADDHVRQNRRPRADRRTAPHGGRLDFPVELRLELARRGRRARIGVVDERDAVPDEDLILDGDAFADERVARNLAATAHLRVLLDLDERADFGFVANLAAVQVDELPKRDVVPQLDVRRNGLLLVHQHQQAPFPAMTAAGVWSRILMSVHSERVRAYRRSRRTISSKVVRLRPVTCHSPVIPGFASTTRRQCHGLYSSTSYGSGGRGPTSDISPRRTFQSCGSSSRLVLRRKCPIGVTRGSFAILKSAGFPVSVAALTLALMNFVT